MSGRNLLCFGFFQTSSGVESLKWSTCGKVCGTPKGLKAHETWKKHGRKAPETVESELQSVVESKSQNLVVIIIFFFVVVENIACVCVCVISNSRTSNNAQTKCSDFPFTI